MDNVKLVKSGLSDHHQDIAMLCITGNPGWNTFSRKAHYYGGNKLEPHPLTYIDYYVKQHSIPMVDFIKLDVEGLDLQVLNGAKETILANDKIVIMMEVHCYENTKEEFFEFFSKYNFVVFDTMTSKIINSASDMREEIIAIRNYK